MPANDGDSVAWSAGTVARMLRPWAPLLALIVLCVGFGLGEPGFATAGNLWTVADRSAIPLILAVGMTFVLLQGSIDLSTEGVMAASSLIFAICVLNGRTVLDLGLFGVVLGSLAGAVLGLLSGVLVTQLRVPSFMVTLGTGSVGMGIAMLISGDQPPLIHDQMLRDVGLGRTLVVPNLVIVAVIILILGWVLQGYTRFGRYSMMIGGGEDLARLSGLPVDRYKVLAFAFAGFLSGLGGVLESARLGLGHVEIGRGQMFATLTAAVIGGTWLGGGRGGVLQSAVGVLMLAVLTDGMIFVGITPYAQKAVEGALILSAVLVTTWNLRSSLRIVK
ncbi:MAG TPA: ABC transporter permease [Bradyrhizobium sp.]|nr:ABC transporter permease [Bradyrhizobium sp.]